MNYRLKSIWQKHLSMRKVAWVADRQHLTTSLELPKMPFIQHLSTNCHQYRFQRRKISKFKSN